MGQHTLETVQARLPTYHTMMVGVMRVVKGVKVNSGTADDQPTVSCRVIVMMVMMIVDNGDWVGGSGGDDDEDAKQHRQKDQWMDVTCKKHGGPIRPPWDNMPRSWYRSSSHHKGALIDTMRGEPC